MSSSIKKRPEPIDERGSVEETPERLLYNDTGPKEKAPPPRLPSLTFPTDRLPQLGIEIVKRLPGVGVPENTQHVHNDTNYNIDPSLPTAVVADKPMYNLWHETKTQTDVTWSKPSNHDRFQGMLYQVQVKIGGNEDWKEVTEARQCVFRVYYLDGVARFGKHRVSSDTSIKMVKVRIRPVGETVEKGMTQKHFGPWSQDILFSLEAASL